MKTQRVRNSEKGQSLIELAIMGTVILVLLAGVVDLGRMMYEYLTMRDAIQEGAGYGTIYPGYCNEIAARVMDSLPDANFTVAVTVDGMSCSAAYAADAAAALSYHLPSHACSGKTLSITLDRNFMVSMPLLGTIVDPTGDGVPMHVDIEDRIVRPECE
ncbi:MAG TPA: TadE family protein [Bellilinea sp.]